jgi:hypothetical protein
MAFGCSEIHEPALGEQAEPAAVAQPIFVDVLARARFRCGPRSRATPVVVSSMPPVTPAMRSVRAEWRRPTKSAPSSQCELRPMIEREVDVFVILLHRLAAAREHGKSGVDSERPSNIVLRRERIAGAQAHERAAGLH